MRHQLALVVASAALCASCARAPSSAPQIRDSGVRRGTVTVRERFPSQPIADPGASTDEMRELAPRIATIRAEPDDVLIAVGDTFSLTRFDLQILDSAGTQLARTRRFGFGLRVGPVSLIRPPVVRGNYSGVGVVGLLFPKTAWVGRKDSLDDARLRVRVGAQQTAASVAEAWGIRIMGRVHADVFSVPASTSNATPKTVRAIVLWRAQPGWCAHPCGGIDPRTLDDSLTGLRKGAVAATRAGSGGSARGVLWWAELARSGDSLYVRGVPVALGAPDSTLVVLVDRLDAVGGAPEIVATTRIAAQPLPQITVHVPARNLVAPTEAAGAAIASMVRRSKLAAAFLDSSKTTPPPGFVER